MAISFPAASGVHMNQVLSPQASSLVTVSYTHLAEQGQDALIWLPVKGHPQNHGPVPIFLLKFLALGVVQVCLLYTSRCV